MVDRIDRDVAYAFALGCVVLAFGLTGWGLMLGGQGAEESARLDRVYARHQSLRLDVEVVALSFAVNVLGKSRINRALRDGRIGGQVSRLAQRGSVGTTSSALVH